VFSLPRYLLVHSFVGCLCNSAAINMDGLSATSSQSRRSFPNLAHLSLAPLSSRFPIDDEGYDENDPQGLYIKSSYIQGKSLPTTPGILAGGSKPRSKTKKSKYAHDSFFPSAGKDFDAPITKAKSASVLTAKLEGLSMTEETSLLSRNTSRPTIQNNDEWLHRAGVMITSTTREYKGQSWLTSRDSSTSLVQQGEDHDDSVNQKRGSDDGLRSGLHSRQHSRAGSKAGSRVGSARPSRRGSRVGSRIEFLTPMDARLPNSSAIDGYFDEELAVEPDFVYQEDEEGIEAEAEIQRLSKDQGFGLGGIIDKLVGLPLFNVDEDSEDEDKIKAEETTEELHKRRQKELRRRKEELAKAANNSAQATTPRVIVEPPRQNGDDGEGGWNDVAWLLSVASKVIL